MNHYIKVTPNHDNCTCSSCGKEFPSSCGKEISLSCGKKITDKESTSLFKVSFIQTRQSFSLCWNCLTELSLELTYAELQERMKKAYPTE